MSIIAESAAQKARLLGAKASLRKRGRLITVNSNNEEDDGFEGTALIDDLPMMMDPDRPAQGENPVYSVVAILAGSIDDPRNVTGFVEVNSQLNYTTLEFMETTGDRIWWKWKCTAQRESFS